MEKAVKFLGLCVLISVIALSLAIAFNGLCNRYYLKYITYDSGSRIYIFDKLTGVIYTAGDKGNYKFDFKENAK